MTLRWAGKTWYSEYDVRGVFGITPETLELWRVSSPLLTVRMGGETFYEEQSLRACIARHQGDKK